MTRKNPTVELGDRYIKVDTPDIIWVVSHALSLENSIPHVRLVQDGAMNRKITLSVSALRDASLYSKIKSSMKI